MPTASSVKSRLLQAPETIRRHVAQVRIANVDVALLPAHAMNDLEPGVPWPQVSNARAALSRLAASSA